MNSENHRRFLLFVFVLGLTACGESVDKEQFTFYEPENNPPADPVQEPGQPTDPIPDPTTEPPGYEEIATGLFRVQGIEADLPFGDLKPLGQMVENATFVGLGETIHTSGGYYQAKYRMIRYLVEEEGFRAFGIESPWVDAEKTRAYAESCDGSLATAVRGLFGVWQSDSMAHMLHWMCEFNMANPDDPLHFYGFDVQQPWDDFPALSSYLSETLPDESEELIAGLSSCYGVDAADVFEFYQSDLWERLSSFRAQEEASRLHEACDGGLRALESIFESRRAELISQSTQEATDWAEIHLVGLRAWQDQLYEQYARFDHVRSFEVRDRGMAHLATRIRELRFPEARTILWAHNTHLAKAQYKIEGPYEGGRGMGTFLYEELGSAYFAVGLLARVVQINWAFDDPFPIVEPSAVETILSRFDEPFLLFDLHRQDLLTPIGRYGIAREMMIPSEQFDALFYLEHSEAMVYFR